MSGATFAEYIVSYALGVTEKDGATRHTWDCVDHEYNGKTIEVKARGFARLWFGMLAELGLGWVFTVLAGLLLFWVFVLSKELSDEEAKSIYCNVRVPILLCCNLSVFFTEE